MRKNYLAFWRKRRAGRCKATRRRRCGVIVEERQRNRYPPAAAPLRAAARRPAGCVARSLHTTRYGWARPSSRRSRLASGPGGRSKMQPLFIDRPLEAASPGLRPIQKNLEDFGNVPRAPELQFGDCTGSSAGECLSRSSVRDVRDGRPVGKLGRHTAACCAGSALTRAIHPKAAQNRGAK